MSTAHLVIVLESIREAAQALHDNATPGRAADGLDARFEPGNVQEMPNAVRNLTMNLLDPWSSGQKKKRY